MRKLSFIRSSINKWKQCLRGHLLLIQFNYLWIQTCECFCISSPSFFFRKTKTKKFITPNLESRNTLVSMKIVRKGNRAIYIRGTRNLSDDRKKEWSYWQNHHGSWWGFNPGSILFLDLINTNLKINFHAGKVALPLLPWDPCCMNLDKFLILSEPLIFFLFVWLGK